MDWLGMFAFFWLLWSAYGAYILMNQQARLKQLEEMTENSAEYELMFELVPQRLFFGVFAAVQLFVAVLDSLGFALSYTYLEIKEPWGWGMLAVAVCYYLEVIQTFAKMQRFQRAFNEAKEPLRLVGRYLRYSVTVGNPVSYPAHYGKCFIALNFFLYGV